MSFLFNFFKARTPPLYARPHIHTRKLKHDLIHHECVQNVRSNRVIKAQCIQKIVKYKIYQSKKIFQTQFTLSSSLTGYQRYLTDKRAKNRL